MAVNGILGIKLGMAQVFAEDGSAVGCTVLQAGPCVVVQRRTKEKDGYDAAQLGLVEFIKPQRVTKPMTGHFKKADVAEGRQFFEDLVAEVSAGMAQGKSLVELKQSIRLEKYKDWGSYQRLREDDIEAAYNNLKIYR